MKNAIQKMKKFYADHDFEIVALATTAVTLTFTVGAIVVISKMNTSALETSLDFIESKGLGGEFLAYVIEE